MGFLERPDWQRAIQIPIGHILAGTVLTLLELQYLVIATQRHVRGVRGGAGCFVLLV